MTEDFRGWATKNDLRCSDGRVIRHDAFKANDGAKVPLVWQHGHNDVSNVLGHAILENRPEGVYAYGYLNDSPKGEAAKDLLLHGDITSMSIYANKLKQVGSDVIHGNIVEVSLVLSGANPGAIIENVSIRHSDGVGYDEIEDEAIIHAGIELDDEPEENIHIQHADEPEEEEDVENEVDTDDETIEDVYNSMSEKQKTVLHAMLAMAVESAGSGETAEHSDDYDEEEDMAHSNIFERNSLPADAILSDDGSSYFTHADIEAISNQVASFAINEGTTLKNALAHAAKQYGISNVEDLFPNAKVNGKPSWFKPEDAWVEKILDKTSHTPFARLKSMQIDLTEEQLRAKGYITADQKKDGVYRILARETTPQTVYIRSKLDRDDIIDVTEHDIVAYTKEAMRVKFRYELARAILIGDGRQNNDREKIQEEHIRPIYNEDDFYATKHVLPATVANSELPDQILRSQKNFKGHGTPTLFTTFDVYMDMLLAKDKKDSYRRLYRTEQELCAALHVSEIVVVDALENTERTVGGKKQELLGILVNPSDYNIGRDKGGDIFNAEDFDIDFNQYKYLMETRMSGALTEPKTAIVLERIKAAGN